MPLSPAVDGVAFALANDTQLLSYKGLTPSSDKQSIAAYILKTEETDDIVKPENLPLILIYTRPGKPDALTKQMYYDKVVVDVFAKDDYNARLMADRVFDVLHNANLQSPTFQVSVCRFAYASTIRTGLVGVRAHRLWFDVSYYIG